MSIEDRVKMVVLRKAKRDLSPADVSRETPLIGKELGLDSVNLFEVVLALEKELGIVIEESDLSVEVFTNIGSLTDHVKKKCHSQ
jgi:acyl carrier protein